MKKKVLLIVALGVIGCTSIQEKPKEIDVSELIKLDGKYYSQEEIDGLKGFTGRVVQYHMLNKDILIGEVNLKDGIKDGKVIGYRPDGTIHFEQNYKEGELHGKSIGYYENGLPSYSKEFFEGKTEGVYSLYYGNGQLKFQEQYTGGLLTGDSLSYSEDGELLEKVIYSGGKVVEKINYQEELDNTNEPVKYILSIDQNQSRIEKTLKE